MKSKARARLRKQKPDLLVGSPMCTLYSAWQRLNKNKNIGEYGKRFKDARAHMEFNGELYLEQIRAGRLLLHEHPEGASSWDEECIKQVFKSLGMNIVVTDQCQFGQQSREGNPIRKPTKWMSNCGGILEALAKRCAGAGGCVRKPEPPIRHVLDGQQERLRYTFSPCAKRF